MSAKKNDPGVAVKLLKDGNTGLTFETPLCALTFSEKLYQAAYKVSLLQQVIVVDDHDPFAGAVGYICSVKRDTATMHLEVCLYPSNKKKYYRIDQLKISPKTSGKSEPQTNAN